MIKNFSYTYIIINIIVVLILFFPINILAQHVAICNIVGKVIDEKQMPISYASIAIYNGTIPIAGIVTDDDGEFVIKIEQSELEYRLAVDFIGYTKYEGIITPNKPNVNLGIITLKENTVVLGEVVVSAKEVAQKATVEHTTINASANMMSSKGTVVDILQSASSVSISSNEISIRGNRNILVLMDGVPTTVSDLSAIPAANVQSIEIITNPDVSHDAVGTGGIINIVSKKSQAEGFSGMASANYGFNHFVNGNIALSYNSPKMLWRFNYNTKYEDDVVKSTLNRKVHSLEYETFQQMHSTRYTFNNNISLGADLRINPRNRLNVEIKAIIPRLNIKQNLHNIFTNGYIPYEEFRNNDVTWNRENVEGAVSYTHIIKPDVSDVSFRGSVSKIWGRRPSYYSVDSIPINRSVSGGSPFISAIQVDYKYKFRNGTLSTGVKFTYRRNDIYHEFYELLDDNWVYSESMSNDLLHTEFVPAVYAMFSSNIGKSFTYKGGLRGEYSSVTINSRHDAIAECKKDFFLSPSLSGTYKLGNNQDLSLAFSRRIGRPTYPQLNPYMSMVDATTYEQGNMHLDPEKATKIDLGYNLHNDIVSIFVNGYLNYTTDYISQIIKMERERLITTYANADYDLKTGVELLLKVKPVKWIDISVGANTYYVTTNGVSDGVDVDNRGWTNNSNLMLDFFPWTGGGVQLQYFVTSPQYYPQLTTALTHQMNIGLKQRILNGIITVSALVTDVFNTAKWEVWSRNTIFDLSNTSRNKNRMLWLGVSYNFNSFRQKSNQKSENDRTLIKLGL